jgi:polyhydroxyalkanoate synthase subunit PhaC
MDRKATLTMAKPSPSPLLPEAQSADPAAQQGAEARMRRLFDPFGINATFGKIQQAWLNHPREMSKALEDLLVGASTLQMDVWNRTLGLRSQEFTTAAEADERFTDPSWSENTALSLIKQHYLFYTRWLEKQIYDTPNVEKKERRHAAFWARQWFNTLAPSNYLFTNPVALKKFYETGGKSLAQGVKNLADDISAGDLRMVDGSAFKVGGNLATTPGAVVLRNHLLEVIHYAPTRERVRAIPLVIIPPWINKYYILDLNEHKSLVRYLVNQGFSVFITSWKNPTREMADTTFDDYMLQGILQAIKVACSICKVPRVHAVGYCLGGTALSALMGWLNKEYPKAEDVPVAHWTLLASLVDFSRPGEIEAFINDDALATIDEIMAKQGYLDGKAVARSFRMLRPNSLIWHYYVHSYLYGEQLPAFDVLYWNTDATRMPRAMHSWYLREFYVHNRLVQKDGVTLGGHAIDLKLIRQPLYAVGSQEDHITPWRGTFKTCTLVNAPVRYALSSSGHILGIVNPPVTPPKRSYWAGPWDGEEDGKLWHAKQKKLAGSWWEDWSAWLHKRCGPMQAPAPLSNRTYKRLCDAPGTYVLES